jgi:NADH-quinone oxidoreductase subunit N
MHSVNFLSPFLTGVLAVLTIFFGVFLKERIAKTFSIIISILGILLAFLPLKNAFDFASAVQSFPFALIMGGVYQVIIAFIAITSIIIIANDRRLQVSRFETYPMIALSFAGMLFAIFSENMIGLYLGIELTSIAGYIIASLNRENAKSNESAMKYFLIGAVSSCVMIYGLSLVYGFAGGNFELNQVEPTLLEQNKIGLIIGFLMFFFGLFFKTTTFPFHFWASDVYSGMNSSSLSFISIAPKIMAFFVMLKILLSKIAHIPNGISAFFDVITILAGISMLVGALGALRQNEIKKILAYSGIAHMGFVLSFFSVNFLPQFVLYYFIIYTFINVGIFAVISALSRNPEYKGKVENLSGLAKSNKFLAFAMAVFMFSSAGIPPLAGFFAKYAVLVQLIGGGKYLLAVVAVVASIISSYYYLRIIKVMYFDEQTQAFALHSKEKIGFSIKFLIGLCIFANITFIFV